MARKRFKPNLLQLCLLIFLLVSFAFALENNRPVIANPQFTLDMEQASKSMEKLLALDADTHYCYHGGVYSSVEGSR
jgi:7-cyano-7-deazaguanine synthase in queuosine biosynthesis